MHLSLSAPLDAAFSGALPGSALPPGPRTNTWVDAGATLVTPPQTLVELIDALWHPGAFHLRPDGAATTIPTRPVPSAGACYPVRTHLVYGGGTRYVVDHESLAVYRRDDARDFTAGSPSDPADSRTAQIVFTVLPGRTFGRYRHRAWPLWIADVAYAVAAVRFLLGGLNGGVTLGPSAHLRSLLAMPPAMDHEAWISRGLIPEIPLAAIEITDAAAVLPERRRALRDRRSPSLEEFLALAKSTPPTPEVAAAAAASGQTWVRGASAVQSWSVRGGASAPEVARALWSSHFAAADSWYAASLSGSARMRPVSGFIPTGDRWILHAVAAIPTGGP